MGMPTLKRFARPLDWAGIDAVLRGYARTVQKASARGQKALHSQRQRPFRLPLEALLPGQAVAEEKQATGSGRGVQVMVMVTFGCNVLKLLSLSLQALPAMTLRLPGESRKHLRSRHLADLAVSYIYICNYIYIYIYI